MQGSMSTIHYLVPKMDSLLHSTDFNGYNIIHWATVCGQADVVRSVIDEYKIDPAARTKVSVY